MTVDAVGIGPDVAADAAGNVVFTSSFDVPVDGWGFDTGTSLLMTKYDPAGNVIWTQSFLDALGLKDNVGVRLDSAGNVMVAGSLYFEDYYRGWVAKYRP